ncbi:MAG: SAM-dependent methyltransferase [Acidobacteriia bacterium]|nr:SAM-dependent methyltransferase [Terriglobia bacterium]
MPIPGLRRGASLAARCRDLFSRSPKGVPYCPTPFAVARQMLEFASVAPADTVYDLGSGDGRIPILAAQEFGCRAVGVEINGKLWRDSSDLAKRLRLEERVEFRRGSFFETDVRAATVVTLYLLTATNGALQFHLASQLPPGARVVTVDYPVPGWRVEQQVEVKSENNVSYTLFLYRRQAVAAAEAATAADLREVRG